MTDPYRHIYDGNIFQKSQCIWHENTTMDWFRSQLLCSGYESVSKNNKTYQKKEHRVVICLIDDITTCSAHPQSPVTRSWDQTVDVITDNRVLCPTLYRVHQLPVSWFGIYWHPSSERLWSPDRRFCLAINRLDIKRMLIFLEYSKRLMSGLNGKVEDYVNFNCWSWNGNNDTIQGLQENFKQHWLTLKEQHRLPYQETHDRGLPKMPYRNHNLNFDQASYHAWINLVIETYSGDSVIALSEKIFRALVTPVPWMAYSARHTVTYLESMGFDCLTDIVNHSYDEMVEKHTMTCGDKIFDWWWLANCNYKKLLSLDFNQLQIRCCQAAEHNKQMLANMRSKWTQDLNNFWKSTMSILR